MTFDLEVMLRGDERVYTERISHAREAAEWADTDVDQILKKILHAIHRLLQPAGTPTGPVLLRGLSWIVSPHEGGVVIALEIHSASAVAGPFQLERAALEQMIERVLRAGHAGPATVH